jgi:hypothetical protein
MIKFVYNNWKDDQPIPNGKQNTIGLHHAEFETLYDVINMLNNDDYKFKNISLENVDKNSYYIIYHHCKLSEMIKLNKWILSKDVEEKIITKNLKIVFLNLHESFDNMEFEIKKIQEFIIKTNLPENNFYILNNNSNLYDIKNKIKTNINVFKTKWLIEYMNTTNLKNIKLISNKKFIFLLHNRIPRPHRISLLVLLKKFNLLEENIIDWSLPFPNMPRWNPIYNDHKQQNILEQSGHKILGDKTYFINIFSKELRPFYKTIITNPKLSYYETNKDWFNDVNNNHNSSNYNELNSFEQSYINIVSETHYSIKDIHFTEKTFRPFYCFQIPIFLASYNHVKMLREEYNFYLFDDLIDHNYDNEIDDIKRLHMIVNEIKRLSTMKDIIQEYYLKNEKKFIENRKYVESFSNNKSTLGFFKNLIVE